MQHELRNVPDAGVVEAPACPECHTPFALWRGQGTAHELWKQACMCPSTSGMEVDGRWQRVQYFNSARLGQQKHHYCLLCNQPLATGEQAIYGLHGLGYVGYAHPACHEREQQHDREALEARQRAAQGVTITVWFSLDDPTRQAPTTGHRDIESRSLPASLPELPSGAVVYGEYLRPLAMSRVQIPDLAAAEAWWEQATAASDVRYELHWFGQAEETASRSWTAKGFAGVQSRAALSERMAEQGYA